MSSHERLTELFGEALDVPPGERAAWLAKIRAVDGHQLADELASLLAADAKDGLTTAGMQPIVDAATAPIAMDDLPSIPGYAVTGVIGEGGMGTVYRAEQRDPARPVAIKVLHVRSGSALARFKAEAKIMARLDHPGIARVLEAGEARGQPFLVMEHVEGTTLDVYTATLSLERKLRLFAALCDAVHHAHVKGVIHRDLKPANVMVKAGPTPGVEASALRRGPHAIDPDHVVVLDFGVARLADDDTPNQTRAGDLLGTPVYMSPEQAGLRAGEVDARSDGYTLGVMLYELICGELPYDVRGVPLPAVTFVITEDPPIPLRKRDATLPIDLEAITDRALRKEPEHRYPSVAALAEDVRRYLEGLPVSVRVPGTRERALRFVKRRPLAAALLAGSVLAFAAFATIVTSLWRNAEHARAEAESRTNALTLRQAREALARDPTEALRWLDTLTTRDVDPAIVESIAHEAHARGVAVDVLREHADEVHWVEPVPNSDDFVTGGYDGRALLWHGATATPLFVARRGRIHEVQPSPTGDRFAIGGDYGELHVVERDGRVLNAFAGHEGDVQHLAWSHDGAWLASSDDHGNVWAWRRGIGPGQQLVDSSSAIGAVEFGPGAILVAASHDGTVWRWDLATGAMISTRLDNDVDEVWAGADRVATVEVTGVVRWWRVVPGPTPGPHDDELALERTVTTERRIKRALVGPDGTWVLLGGVGGEVLRVANRIDRLGTHRAQIRSLAVSATGRWIADGSDDGSLTVHDLETGREHALRGHNGKIRHLAFARDGMLLSSDADGVVRRWNVAAIPPHVLDGGGAPLVQLTGSRDGKLLATVDETGEIALWTVATGSRRRLGAIRGRVRDLAIVDEVVVTATAEGAITWWLDPAAPLTREVGGAEALAVSHDRVAVATSRGPIRLFGFDGSERETLPGHASGTLALAFDRTGAMLASGGQDRELRLWSRATGTFALARELRDIPSDTHFLAFTPTHLVSAGKNGEVTTYALAGEQRTVVARHVGAVAALALAADAIVSAGRDSTIVRTPFAGAQTRATLRTAATDLAIDARGAIRAITRAGAVERWRGDASAPVVEIDHGARTGLALGSPARWAFAIDSAVVLAQ